MTLVKNRRYLARFLGMSGTDPLYGVKASDGKPSLLVQPLSTIGAHSCGRALVISLPCAERTSLESAWVGQEIDIYNASDFEATPEDEMVATWNDDQRGWMGLVAKCCPDDEGSKEGQGSKAAEIELQYSKCGCCRGAYSLLVFSFTINGTTINGTLPIGMDELSCEFLYSGDVINGVPAGEGTINWGVNMFASCDRGTNTAIFRPSITVEDNTTGLIYSIGLDQTKARAKCSEFGGCDVDRELSGCFTVA